MSSGNGSFVPEQISRFHCNHSPSAHTILVTPAQKTRTSKNHAADDSQICCDAHTLRALRVTPITRLLPRTVFFHLPPWRLFANKSSSASRCHAPAQHYQIRRTNVQASVRSHRRVRSQLHHENPPRIALEQITSLKLVLPACPLCSSTSSLSAHRSFLPEDHTSARVNLLLRVK